MRYYRYGASARMGVPWAARHQAAHPAKPHRFAEACNRKSPRPSTPPRPPIPSPANTPKRSERPNPPSDRYRQLVPDRELNPT